MEIDLFTLPLSHLRFEGFLAIFGRVHFHFPAGLFDVSLCVDPVHYYLQLWIPWNQSDGTFILGAARKGTSETKMGPATRATSRSRKNVAAHSFYSQDV